MAIENKVTHSRLGRISLLGKLAGGMIQGALNEGFNQLASGQKPALKNLLLTPDNARRLSDKLAEMRGAAMKVGQLISMDGGQILPKEFTSLLANLRQDANRMPMGQLVQVMNQTLGTGWEQEFAYFNFTPIAAASIGQVHEARLKNDRHIAIKVQYPDIKNSIDSDVDNVATLLKIFRLLPEHLDIKPLLNEAKHQLHIEADYRLEAKALEKFSRLVKKDERFSIPETIPSLSSDSVLSMTFIEGHALENCFECSREERHSIAVSILELCLKEVFEWGVVQTDPNFANYRYDFDSRKIGLLDFGATREYDIKQQLQLRDLLRAAVDGSDEDLSRSAYQVGYLKGDESLSYERQMLSLLRMVTEPFNVSKYDFGQSDLANRMSESFMQMRLKDQSGHLPPTELLFLHRKLGGLYLLLSQLRASLDLKDIPVVAKILNY
jgi:predicted unusual protein kinase regulating ubiquinone biosynthesis (AarF/ABC1/UbiB family)